jgi:alpha-L-fucosidase
MKMKFGFVVLLAAMPLVAASAEKKVLNETSAQRDARLHWWREARFGMFIHWGPVSLKGTEISWSRANSNLACPNKGPIPVEVYDNLYRQFNPTNFNGREWAAVAKDAGMKYVVLTAKHCDGFCLWPTKVIAHHIGNSPFRRDVCGELAAAAQRAGLRIGWYYSPMDWYDPDCRMERNAAYVQRMQAQLRELLTPYGRIDLLWFDWDGGTIPWDQDNTYRLVRALQPRLIVNNRLDCRYGGFSADRYIGPNADYYTPEQVIGAYDDQHPWETCMTLGTQWSWKPNDQIKSVRETIHTLVNCAGGDGNLLLNVGPMPDGRIEPRQVEVLKGVGAWLKTHGESIYGTRGGPWKPGPYGVSTRKGKTVFVHLFESANVLTLPPITAKILRSRVLTGGKAKVNQSATGVEISLPAEQRQETDTIVALELDSDAMRIPATAGAASGSLTTHAKVTASNVYHNLSDCGPDKAVDDDAESRWVTDAEVKQAWLEVDLGQPRRFDRALITEAFPNRVQKFELQYFNGDAWKTFSDGTTIGHQWSRRFEAVTAQRVRLNIRDATIGPTIWEFQLFEAAK